MARINFNDVTEATGNGGLPNGPYVLKVVSASWQERNSWGDEQTYAEIVFDVAEGRTRARSPTVPTSRTPRASSSATPSDSASSSTRWDA